MNTTPKSIDPTENVGAAIAGYGSAGPRVELGAMKPEDTLRMLGETVAKSCAPKTSAEPISVRLPEFFNPFRSGPEELIYSRFIAPRNCPPHLYRDYEKQKAPPSTVKRSAAYPQLIEKSEYLKDYRDQNKRRGPYWVVNPGGDADLDVKRFIATYSENDPPEGVDVREFIAAQVEIEPPLDPSALIKTYKSLHRYWLIDGDCDRETWLLLQQGQIAFYKSDPSIMNESRVMRMPNFNHLRVDYVNDCLLYKPIELLVFEPSRKSIRPPNWQPLSLSGKRDY